MKYELKVDGLADGISATKLFDNLEDQRNYPKGVSKIFAIPNGPDWASAVQVTFDPNATSIDEIKNYFKSYGLYVSKEKELKSLWKRFLKL